MHDGTIMTNTEDVDIDWDAVEIQWHGPVPEIENIEQLIRKDCKQSLWGLSKVSSLIFHTIFVGKTMDDEQIIAWGEEGNEQLHIEYITEPKWINLRDE